MEARVGGGTKIWTPPSYINADMVGVPRCSPNGAEIAYSVKRDDGWKYFYIHTIDSKSEQYYREYNALTGFTSWTDSNNFAFMTYDNDKILIIKAYGNPSDITPEKVENGERIDVSKYPSLSPNGQQLAFYCRINNKRYICLLTVGSNTAQTLHQVQTRDFCGQSQENTPMWSGDGEWIYFSSSEDGDWDIYRMRPDGSEVQNLTDDWDTNELMPALRW